MLNVLPLALSVAVFVLSSLLAHILIGSLDEQTVSDSAAQETKCKRRAHAKNLPIENVPPEEGFELEEPVKKLLLRTSNRVVRVCAILVVF
ncbi:hypothetical protein ANCCAN_08077 [Ancylostoma caninum]|uniref:Uncharacterized protein n=1 Tax=Ancylostoma caninum TaxID=29170 RepID=A0A368GNH0_ANCCA|nr:hypothetical protein ANCCAN_08077 [Ancylostoma caninum]